MIEGRCHCGALSWRAASRPRWLTQCTCSYCRRAAALWGELAPDQIAIDMPSQGLVRYVHGDATLEFVSCARCGNLSHWRSLFPPDRLKLNFRLADPGLLAGLEVRTFDGADSWTYLD